MYKRLDHFADIHYGKSPLPFIDVDGVIPVYGTGGVYAWASKSLFSGPAIVVPRKGSIGSPQFADGPLWASDTTYALLPKSGVDPRWLYYQILIIELEKLNEATGVPSISRDWLAKIDIADQGERTQAFVSSRIQCLEQHITETEALIAKQEQVRAGLMQDLFSRGVDETGRLRPPREVAAELYHKTELGWLPRAWKIEAFERAATSTMLGTVARGAGKSRCTIPLIKMGNIKWGELDLADVEPLDWKAKFDERQILKNRDFLFNTRNTPELVGKSAIYHSEFDVCTYDNNVLRVRFREDIVPEIVCAYMSFGHGRQQVNALATGTTSVAAIYWTALRKFLFPHPSSEHEARSIVSMLSASKKPIQNLKSELRKLKMLRAGLLQDLLKPPSAGSAALRIAAE